MFSNDKNIETIGQLVAAVRHYIGLQTDYAKLDVMTKVVRVLTLATMTAVLSLMLMLALIYLSFAAAYAMGSLIGLPLSFLAVALFYIAALVTCVCLRKSLIERPLVRILASILLTSDNSKPTYHDQQ